MDEDASRVLTVVLWLCGLPCGAQPYVYPVIVGFAPARTEGSDQQRSGSGDDCSAAPWLYPSKNSHVNRLTCHSDLGNPEYQAWLVKALSTFYTIWGEYHGEVGAGGRLSSRHIYDPDSALEKCIMRIGKILYVAVCFVRWICIRWRLSWRGSQPHYVRSMAGLGQCIRAVKNTSPGDRHRQSAFGTR